MKKCMAVTCRLMAGLALVVAGCGDDGAATDGAGHDAAGGDATPVAADAAYEPFAQGNLQNQLVRVGAFDQIQAIRKGAGFAAGDFGGSCDDWSPAVKVPSDPTRIASLYVESASLAEKVAGRQDDHAWKRDGAAGEVIHASICDAIAAGSAATGDKDAVGGIAWQGQVVDKALQHFFYLSVYHEMVQGTRKNWDEAVGYYGYDLDGRPDKAGGIARTAASRDGNCGTTYARDIFEKLVEGKALLDSALTAAGKAGNEDALEVAPEALQKVIGDVDRMLLDVFALSFGRELVALAAGDEPVIKLIEGRMFWRILTPYVADHDAREGTTYAPTVTAMMEQDDPGQVDTAAALDAVKAVFGLDVAGLCD